jgi:hypothetical protein
VPSKHARTNPTLSHLDDRAAAAAVVRVVALVAIVVVFVAPVVVVGAVVVPIGVGVAAPAFAGGHGVCVVEKGGWANASV